MAVGLVHALDRRGVRVGFCKPIAQPHGGDTGPERSSRLIELVAGFSPPTPLSAAEAEDFFAHGQRQRLFEEVVARFEEAAGRADVVVLEGLVATPEQPYAAALNAGIASSLDAEIILVTVPGESTPAELSDTLELAAQTFGGTENRRVLGAILNQVGAPSEARGFMRLGEAQAVPDYEAQVRADAPIFKGHFKLLGAVPWERALLAPRVADVAEFLEAEVVHQGRPRAPRDRCGARREHGRQRRAAPLARNALYHLGRPRGPGVGGVARRAEWSAYRGAAANERAQTERGGAGALRTGVWRPA